MPAPEPQDVQIDAAGEPLPGSLCVVPGAGGVVVFAHGSGSSRYSVRNQAVARRLQDEGFSTLLFDLLTAVEDRDIMRRFDLDLLSERLVDAIRWVDRGPAGGVPIGLFGASTGAAAALRAAVEIGPRVRAVVSRGGRPDLAKEALARVQAATLLIVGGADPEVWALNREARERLPEGTVSCLEVIEGATHLFEEPGALDRVAVLAAAWFRDHLRRGVASPDVAQR